MSNTATATPTVLPNLVAITGLIGAGKSTIQKVLMDRGYQPLTYAKAMKDACAAVHTRWNRKMLEGDTPESRAWRKKVDPYYSDKLGIPDYTPRMALQLMGTECMRKGLHQNIWVVAVMAEVDAHPDRKVVIADARFPNEVQAVKDRGGVIIHVTRGPEHEAAAQKKLEEGALHKSEHMTLAPDYKADITISNTGTLEELKAKARALTTIATETRSEFNARMRQILKGMIDTMEYDDTMAEVEFLFCLRRRAEYNKWKEQHGIK